MTNTASAYDFQGKVALITGAGRKRGIGRATALRLAEHGADIAVSDVRWEELQTVADEICAMGRQAFAIQADVTKPADVEAMVAETMQRFQRIDILVNNAGLALPMKPVVDIAESEWDLAFDVMPKGTFLCCKYVVPHMIARGEGGKIVSVSSQAGKSGQALSAPYSAAKAAIINFTQSLALELAYHKINVNAICPGIVGTDMGAWALDGYAKVSRKPRTAEEIQQLVLSKIPLRRFARVDEVADLIMFLASAQADYMTGQALNLTGGQTMH
ncbi:MAG: hypothetical protein A2Z03_08265 [Chloroflexi bacterium RBG_16_56_8]|nr:MAG: hypothetical protein A2Z03_08265 [Chloroflexi bacterium RBG_16_56_8]